MPTRVLVNRITEVRRVNRLGWLAGPQPLYGKDVPWFRRPQLPDDQVPEVQQRRIIPWLYVQPVVAAETLAWFRRVQPQPLVAIVEEPQRPVASRFSPQPSYGEQLGWRRVTIATPAAEPEPQLVKRWQPWLTPAPIVSVEQLGWFKRPQPAAEVLLPGEDRREAAKWHPSLTAPLGPAVEYLSWLSPRKAAAEIPTVVNEPARVAWLYGPVPAYKETLAWYKCPPWIPPEPISVPAPIYPSGAVFSIQAPPPVLSGPGGRSEFTWVYAPGSQRTSVFVAGSQASTVAER